MNGHCNYLALKFSVCVKERQDRLPTMYWLPKLHKRPYKARFIANSSSGSTVGFLLLQCSSGVVRHPRDLQVSVATHFCRVLSFASS